MCGIVGYVGAKNCADVLVSALSKLEYRGYDSAGIAVVADGKIQIAKLPFWWTKRQSLPSPKRCGDPKPTV